MSSARTSFGRSHRAERRLWLPGVVQEGGRRGWWAALGLGAVLGGALLVLPALLSDADAFSFFAVFMGVVAGVYLGFALTDGRMSVFQVENVGILIFGALGVLALATGNAWFLVAGYLGHGAWDALHPHAVDTRMPWWYVPACIGFDFAFGIYVVIRLA
ncbi:MAG: hypothetical protein ACRDKT_18175 [Actinomycetota bacterium]